MSIGSTPIIPKDLRREVLLLMYTTKNLFNIKKNSKVLRLTHLYTRLLKVKRLLNFFMGGVKRKQIRTLYHVISDPCWFYRFLVVLEYRLEFLLLKAGFVITGKQARQLILQNGVFLNGELIHAYNVQIQQNDIVSLQEGFTYQYKRVLICELLKTPLFFKFLKKKRIIKKLTLTQYVRDLRFPPFMEVNYRTFTLSITRVPFKSELFLSHLVSTYDVNQLYFLLK